MEEQKMIQKAIEESKRETVNPDQMTYEELLALSEKLGSVAKGFSKEEIGLIRSVKVGGLNSDMVTKSCVICCDNFKSGDCVKLLNCKHEYHDMCIDPWLEKEKHCPVCKQEVNLDTLV